MLYSLVRNCAFVTIRESFPFLRIWSPMPGHKCFSTLLSPQLGDFGQCTTSPTILSNHSKIIPLYNLAREITLLCIFSSYELLLMGALLIQFGSNQKNWEIFILNKSCEETTIWLFANCFCLVKFVFKYSKCLWILQDLHTKGRSLNLISSFSKHVLRTVARHWENSSWW